MPAVVWCAALVLAATARPAPPRPAVAETCATRSQASFPGPRAAADNVVVGPLVLVGARFTPAKAIERFGGDKLFVLVRPGHAVTLELLPQARRHVGLGFGLPEGEVRLRDAKRVVRFEACPSDHPGHSDLDGEPYTLWVGFLVADAPWCAPLRVWIDDRPKPRRTVLHVGMRDCA